jgi:iron complex outermembrane receptor protein
LRGSRRGAASSHDPLSTAVEKTMKWNDWATHASTGTLALLGALTLALDPPAAHAQSQREHVSSLEEVVVTSQKREETLADVPATINVLKGETLAQFNILDFRDLVDLTPSLSLDNISGQKSAISLRGITFDPDSNAASAVDVYWNNLHMHPTAAFQELFDMERIEILRGPQGSLQGRTSPAGAIMLVTRHADPALDHIEGDLQQTFSDNDGTNTQVGVNLPLVPGQLAARVAGIYDENNISGIENLRTGNRQLGRASGGRLSLDWSPSDDFYAALVTEYLEKDGSYPLALAGSRAGAPSLRAKDRKAYTTGDSNTLNRKHATALTMDWEVAGHQFTSVTGYIKRMTDDHFDFDYTDQTPGVIHNTQVHIEEEEFSQELRLASMDTTVWEYMVGLYYRKRDNQTDFITDAVPSNGAISVLNDIPIREEEFGAFTHNIFHLTDRLQTQLGLRWQKIRAFNRADTLARSGLGMPAGTRLLQLISDDHDSSNATAVTGSLKVLYDLTEDVTVYASYERGFRPGGASITPVALPESLILFDNETSRALEVGFKAVLFNGRTQLNGAIYRQDFDNFITFRRGVAVDTSVPLDGIANSSINGLTANADALITGAELEFNTLLTDNWTLGGGLSYNDTEFKNGATLPCTVFVGGVAVTPAGAPVASCDVGGRRIGGEPLWSSVLHSEYTWPLGAVDLFARGLYKFTGARADDDYGNDIGGYGVLNLYLGVRAPDNNWEVSLWAKNLADKNAQSRLPIPLLNTGYSWVQPINERTLGVTLNYKFGN